MATGPHDQPRSFGADRSWRRRIPHVDQTGARPIRRHRRDRRGQRDGGRAGQRQGRAALDPNTPFGARRRTIPGRLVPRRSNRGLHPDWTRLRRNRCEPGHNGAREESLRAGEGGDGPATRPLHRRRGIGPGQLDRVCTLTTGLPAGQRHTASHREAPRTGAQRGDLGPHRPHRSARCLDPSGPAG